MTPDDDFIKAVRRVHARNFVLFVLVRAAVLIALAAGLALVLAGCTP